MKFNNKQQELHKVIIINFLLLVIYNSIGCNTGKESAKNYIDYAKRLQIKAKICVKKSNQNNLNHANKFLKDAKIELNNAKKIKVQTDKNDKYYEAKKLAENAESKYLEIIGIFKDDILKLDNLINKMKKNSYLKNEIFYDKKIQDDLVNTTLINQDFTKIKNKFDKRIKKCNSVLKKYIDFVTKQYNAFDNKKIELSVLKKRDQVKKHLDEAIIASNKIKQDNYIDNLEKMYVNLEKADILISDIKQVCLVYDKKLKNEQMLFNQIVKKENIPEEKQVQFQNLLSKVKKALGDKRCEDAKIFFAQMEKYIDDLKEDIIENKKLVDIKDKSKKLSEAFTYLKNNFKDLYKDSKNIIDSSLIKLKTDEILIQDIQNFSDLNNELDKLLDKFFNSINITAKNNFDDLQNKMKKMKIIVKKDKLSKILTINKQIIEYYKNLKPDTNILDKFITLAKINSSIDEAVKLIKEIKLKPFNINISIAVKSNSTIPTAFNTIRNAINSYSLTIAEMDINNIVDYNIKIYLAYGKEPEEIKIEDLLKKKSIYVPDDIFAADKQITSANNNLRIESDHINKIIYLISSSIYGKIKETPKEFIKKVTIDNNVSFNCIMVANYKHDALVELSKKNRGESFSNCLDQKMIEEKLMEIIKQ